MSNVVDQSRWDDSYQHYQFHSQENALLTHEICRTLQAVGAVPRGRCFEVGCYPCGFLAALGKTYDLEINGVDITSVPFEPLYAWLDSQNVRRGEILRGDAFAVIDQLASKGQSYDLVYSLGFIEHFNNFLEVIDTHDKIVVPGGLLLIATPNFRGWLQHFLHNWLDRKNLEGHVLPSMDPALWARHLANRYDVLFAGHVGGFDFWDEPQAAHTVAETGSEGSRQNKWEAHQPAQSPELCPLLFVDCAEKGIRYFVYFPPLRAY